MATATSFKEAYNVLQGHAETLREQSEPDIDNLLSIVTESVSAYKVCRERIDAVEKALQEALTDVGEGGSRAGPPGEDVEPETRSRNARPARPAKGFDEDDDPPF